MGDVEGENYDSLLRNLTNANTMLLNDASETLEFNSIDSLDQVGSLKFSIWRDISSGRGNFSVLNSQFSILKFSIWRDIFHRARERCTP